MNTVKTRGMVIKSQDYKENDKLIWIYTEELGKISVIAKGARKSKNKNFSNTLPFCYGEYVVYKGRTMYSLNEGRIIDSFQDILDDYETLIYGSYFTELVDIATEEEKSFEIFVNLIKAFYLMKSRAVDLEILARTFEMKLLNATGYGISLENCAICGNPIKGSSFISYQFYGGVCENCENRYGTRVSKASYNGLRYINKIDIEKVGRVAFDRHTKDEMAEVLKSFINLNLRRIPKSLTLLSGFSN